MIIEEKAEEHELETSQKSEEKKNEQAADQDEKKTKLDSKISLTDIIEYLEKEDQSLRDQITTSYLAFESLKF